MLARGEETHPQRRDRLGGTHCLSTLQVREKSRDAGLGREKKSGENGGMRKKDWLVHGKKKTTARSRTKGKRAREGGNRNCRKKTETKRSAKRRRGGKIFEPICNLRAVPKTMKIRKTYGRGKSSQTPPENLVRFGHDEEFFGQGRPVEREKLKQQEERKRRSKRPCWKSAPPTWKAVGKLQSCNGAGEVKEKVCQGKEVGDCGGEEH